MLFSVSDRRTHLGLLIIRLGLAAPLLFQAMPAIMGGGSRWAASAADLGIINPGWPVRVSGLIVLMIKILCATGLITGYFFRICAVALGLFFSMSFFRYFGAGYETLPLYAVTHVMLCLGLMLTGPGKYVVAVKIEKR